MDSWQTVQNWLIFVPIVGAVGYYYYPRGQTPVPIKAREQEVTPVAPKKKSEAKSKQEKKSVPERVPVKAVVESVASAVDAAVGQNQSSKKRKNAGKQAVQAKPTPVVQEEEEQEDAIDMSTKNFAMQMQKARLGQQISKSKGDEQRVKTVKQGSALDKASPAKPSQVNNAGDVSDMLESTGVSAPSTLRVTAPAQPLKKKEPKVAKQEEVETKKQRQNRQKVEERKAQREAEEKERKVLEEQQRRSAREARGEPAKNGIPAKAPTKSAWIPPHERVAAANSAQSAPLLDTFDAESTSSSNNGAGVSTAPSSTTDASEEEQMAAAIQQSNEESGWTTVAVPKKQKQKKPAASDETPLDSTPKASKPKAAPAVKAVSTGKPNGFQALEDTYIQRTDRDPMDASNWDA